MCLYERDKVRKRDSEIGIESDTNTEMQIQTSRKKVNKIKSEKEYMGDSWIFVNIRKELH